MFFRLRSISLILMIFVVGFVIAPEFEVGLAQSESHIEQLAINVTDKQIAFYEVSLDNQLTLLDTFTDFKITNLANRLKLIYPDLSSFQ